MRHFRYYVEGRKFYIVTDHKPLIFVLFSNSNRYSPRQVHHLDFISQFTSDIRHVSGRDNPVADALSCVDIQAIDQLSPSIDFTAMAAAQASNPELHKLQTTSTSLKFAEFPIDGTSVTLLCDTSTGKQCPYVPLKCCFPVFEKLHSLAQPWCTCCPVLAYLQLCGQVLIQTLANGPISVCSVNETRSTGILLPCWPPSLPQMPVSVRSILI